MLRSCAFRIALVFRKEMPLDLREQNRELLSKLLENQSHLKRSISSRSANSPNKKMSSHDARKQLVKSSSKNVNQNIVRENLVCNDKTLVTRSSTPKLSLYQKVEDIEYPRQNTANNENEDTLHSITSLNTVCSDLGSLNSFERKLESSANVRANRIVSKDPKIVNVERIDVKSDREPTMLKFLSKTTDKSKPTSRNNNMEKRNKENLLGYEWIAEMLDANISFESKSDEYFEELQKFRQTNHGDCFGATESGNSEGQYPRPPYQDWPPPSYTSKAHLDKLKAEMEHKCVHLYRMNARGFAIPVNVDEYGESVCPVCKKKRELDSKTMVRITVPKKMLPDFDRIDNSWERELLSGSSTKSGVVDSSCAYRPGDSMGLSKHVVPGWQTARPTCTAPATFVDIKSAATDKGN